METTLKEKIELLNKLKKTFNISSSFLREIVSGISFSFEEYSDPDFNNFLADIGARNAGNNIYNSILNENGPVVLYNSFITKIKSLTDDEEKYNYMQAIFSEILNVYEKGEVLYTLDYRRIATIADILFPEKGEYYLTHLLLYYEIPLVNSSILKNILSQSEYAYELIPKLKKQSRYLQDLTYLVLTNQNLSEVERETVIRENILTLDKTALKNTLFNVKYDLKLLDKIIETSITKNNRIRNKEEATLKLLKSIYTAERFDDIYSSWDFRYSTVPAPDKTPNTWDYLEEFSNKYISCLKKEGILETIKDRNTLKFATRNKYGFFYTLLTRMLDSCTTISLKEKLQIVTQAIVLFPKYTANILDYFVADPKTDEEKETNTIIANFLFSEKIIKIAKEHIYINDDFTVNMQFPVFKKIYKSSSFKSYLPNMKDDNIFLNILEWVNEEEKNELIKNTFANQYVDYSRGYYSGSKTPEESLIESKRIIDELFNLLKNEKESNYKYYKFLSPSTLANFGIEEKPNSLTTYDYVPTEKFEIQNYFLYKYFCEKVIEFLKNKTVSKTKKKLFLENLLNGEEGINLESLKEDGIRLFNVFSNQEYHRALTLAESLGKNTSEGIAEAVINNAIEFLTSIQNIEDFSFKIDNFENIVENMNACLRDLDIFRQLN